MVYPRDVGLSVVAKASLCSVCGLFWVVLCHGLQDLDQGSISHIIGGDNAPPGRYPYMASLRSSAGHQCGATLVAPDVILTAAHCAFQFVEVQLGRSNRSDFDESFESFVTRETETHPFYYRNQGQGAEDVDEFDFALVKLYGSSELPVVSLNREPDLPASEGDELTVLGWGFTDPNSENLASALQETTINYIPNEQCKDFMDFDRRIIGVSMCAIDFVNGEDACRGDSGGPLISVQNGVDVQVGVVSYGIRPCANGVYPGLYARVSYVRNWIDETVCHLSSSPPSDFNCPDKASQEPDFSGDLISLTIELNGYISALFLGWILESTNAEGEIVPYISRRIFSYSELGFREDVKETVEVPDNRAYKLIVLDLNQDIRGSLSVYQGSNITNSTAVYFMDEPVQLAGRSSVSQFDFVVGGLPTASPSGSPSPSATFMPSSAPTMTRPFVTLVIGLDGQPGETGWILEALLGENDPALVAIAYPGTYNQTNTHIEEEIDLFLLGPEPKVYRFTMTDNERNGLCCESGAGFYQVWLGPVSEGNGTLLFEGGQFFLEDVNTFQDVVTSTNAPSFANSPTASGPLPTASPTAPESSPTSATSGSGALLLSSWIQAGILLVLHTTSKS